MSISRIKNILKKEWQVLTGEPTTFLMITLVPFAILGEAMFVIWLITNIGSESIMANPFFHNALDKLIAGIYGSALLSDTDQVRLFLLSQVNFFILLIPTMIAIYSATYSIVEEKLSHSLEPLLATPVRTWELMLGKALAGAVPAMLMTWVCAVVYLLVITVLGWGHLMPYMVTATWFLNLFLLVPAIAMLSFLLGVIGSSRAKDFRNAQNLVLFIIFPVFGIIAVQVTGLVWFTPLLTLGLGMAVVIIDVLVLQIAVRLFQRESIIIGWR